MSFADICTDSDCSPVETMYGNCEAEMSTLALAFLTSGDAHIEQPKALEHHDNKSRPLGCMSVHGTAPMPFFDTSAPSQPLGRKVSVVMVRQSYSGNPDAVGNITVGIGLTTAAADGYAAATTGAYAAVAHDVAHADAHHASESLSPSL